jgi:hypothetical protein
MKAISILLLAGLALASASALPKTAKTSHTLSYKQTMKAKAIGCDICTMVVTEIDKLIIDGEDSIIDAVEGLCATVDGLFPGAGATCNALVESYLPQIIEGLVDNQLSPASVCALLTLCPWNNLDFVNKNKKSFSIMWTSKNLTIKHAFEL